MKNNNFIHGLLGILPIFSFDKPSLSGSAHYETDNSELTGVAKYLQKIDADEAKKRMTSVERYLAKAQAEEALRLQALAAEEEAVRIAAEEEAARIAAEEEAARIVAEEEAAQIAAEAEVSITIEETVEVETSVSRYVAEHPGQSMSGVAKYIVKRSILSKESSLITTVAKYINKQRLVVKQPIPGPTGVEKYLSKNAGHTTTGVEKYLVKRDVMEREGPAATRVDRYVSKQLLQPREIPIIETGVARYISAQQRQADAAKPLTGVDKFLAEQALIAQKAAARALVEKYLEQEARMLEEKQAALANQATVAVAEDAEDDLTAGSAVDRYMAKQARQAKVTGVAKYLAKQLMIETQRAPLSGVERYMAKQALAAATNPEKLTGVSRYVAKQAAVVRTVIVVPQPSTVEQYIAKAEQLQSEQPAVTGVAKYMMRQEQAAKNTNVSGVDKYLAKQAAMPKDSGLAITGVERYLRHQG